MKKRFSFVRACGQWSDILPVAAIISFVLVLIGQMAGSGLIGLTGLRDLFISMTGSEASGTFLAQYSLFIGIWIVILLTMIIFKKNRPMLNALSFRKSGSSVKGALIGLLLGFLTNGFCILMSAIMGDIKLSYNRFSPGIFFAFLLAVTIQSGAEEITDRCYLYQKLRRRYRNPLVAIIGNAALFASMHLMNPGITAVSFSQILIVGILFSLFVYYYDCLWAAIMMHAGWNFTQSIVFGLPNSGIVSEYSLFKLEAASARNGFFYNVNFGVEGSVGAVIVLCLVAAAVIYLGRKKGEKKDYWADMEQAVLEKELQNEQNAEA